MSVGTFFVVQVMLLSIWIPRKKSFFVFLTALLSLIIAGGLAQAAFSGSSWGRWLLAAVSLAFVANGIFLVLLGFEERYLEKQEALRQPISALEAEKGLPWEEIEEWLAKK